MTVCVEGNVKLRLWQSYEIRNKFCEKSANCLTSCLSATPQTDRQTDTHTHTHTPSGSSLYVELFHDRLCQETAGVTKVAVSGILGRDAMCVRLSLHLVAK